ncbi:hypothetical protein [Peribacillus alkalitolerans]|uniref:hypothetical protein n=1 Tax=Peribacillus alkalitolerans TaxID=1550385 RepID=UPI0013D06ACD|nr:hypothetical protein [Peribacillus alkalitolerans]
MNLEIPNKCEYSILLIQGVNKEGENSDLTSKIIKDKEKVKEFIEKVDQMEFVEATKKELSEMNKEQTIEGNYFFVLSDKETMDNKVYIMFFLGDGRIIFQEPNGEQQKINCSSKEKHLGLLFELKRLFNITF